MKQMKHWKVTLVAAAAATASAVALTRDRVTPEGQASRSNNAFGVKLFANTTTRSSVGNKFLSPTSAYLALSIVANGASGNTRRDMEEALAIAPFGRDAMNVANERLIRALREKSDGTELSIANAVWVKEDYEIQQAFLDRVVEPYSSRVERLDFASPKASETINGWTAKETRDKIKNIVPERLPEESRVIVTNAVYFKAKWEIPFAAAETRLARFDNGRRGVDVPMMHSAAHYRYAKLDDGSEAIALPYVGGKTEMIVWLPKYRQLSVAERAVRDGALDAIAHKLDRTKASYGRLALPKLRMEYEASLNEPLAKLGMGSAFDDGADFTDLAKDRLAISSVLQKTFIGIDEEGTEAAAVTAIIVGAASAPPPPTFTMTVDRPYVFAIRHRPTGALLFIGSVQEPEGGKLPPPPKL
jgi:serpin B